MARALIEQADLQRLADVFEDHLRTVERAAEGARADAAVATTEDEREAYTSQAERFEETAVRDRVVLMRTGDAIDEVDTLTPEGIAARG